MELISSTIYSRWLRGQEICTRESQMQISQSLISTKNKSRVSYPRLMKKTHESSKRSCGCVCTTTQQSIILWSFTKGTQIISFVREHSCYRRLKFLIVNSISEP